MGLDWDIAGGRQGVQCRLDRRATGTREAQEE